MLTNVQIQTLHKILKFNELQRYEHGKEMFEFRNSDNSSPLKNTNLFVKAQPQHNAFGEGKYLIALRY